jgi:hypothetical protein
MKRSSFADLAVSASSPAKAARAKPSTILPYAHLLGLTSRVAHAAAAVPKRAATAARAARESVARKVRRQAASETPFADLVRSAEQQLQRDATADAVSAAVAAERVRCGEILAAGLSAGLAAYATHLACKSDLTAAQAISIIRAAHEDRADAAAKAAKTPLTPMQEREARIQWYQDNGVI